VARFAPYIGAKGLCSGGYFVGGWGLGGTVAKPVRAVWVCQSPNPSRLTVKGCGGIGWCVGSIWRGLGGVGAIWRGLGGVGSGQMVGGSTVRRCGDFGWCVGQYGGTAGNFLALEAGEIQPAR